MSRHQYFLFSLVVIGFSVFNCSHRGPTDDKSDQVLRGETIFNRQCASCHSIDKDAIGPALGGITQILKEEWIRRFIKDPGGVIAAGDEHASKMFERYKVVMPPFPSLREDEVSDIIAFLKAQKGNSRHEEIDSLALKDPIPEHIAKSELIVGIKQVTTIPPSSKQGQLTRICKLDYRPDTKQIYVVDLRGKLYELNEAAPNVYLDMVRERKDFIDNPGLATGFGSFAFHPEFRKNGLLYTSHTERAGAAPADFAYDDSIKVSLQWVLTEWKTEHPEVSPFQGKGRELLRVNMVHSYHGFQEITFNSLAKKGDDDYALLYVGIGDGTSVEFGYPELAHSKEKIWGTVIRIDPSGRDSNNGKYGIPASNPFAKDKDVNTVREIFAYGFRNPHRISWTTSGKMMVSNIGHHNVESLYWVLKGRDHGWPLREGTFVMDVFKGMHNIYALPENDSINVNYPIAEYDHDEGNAISGGFEYWGSSIPELKRKYLFGDIVNGRLFYINTDSIQIGKQSPIHEWQVSVNGKVQSLKNLCGADKVDLRFGRDSAGEIYILTKPDGRIYKLMPEY